MLDLLPGVLTVLEQTKAIWEFESTRIPLKSTYFCWIFFVSLGTQLANLQQTDSLTSSKSKAILTHPQAHDHCLYHEVSWAASLLSLKMPSVLNGWRYLHVRRQIYQTHTIPYHSVTTRATCFPWSLEP